MKPPEQQVADSFQQLALEKPPQLESFDFFEISWQCAALQIGVESSWAEEDSKIEKIGQFFNQK